MAKLTYEGRTVFCKDVAASAAFYEGVLGFERESEYGGDVGLRLPVASNAEASVSFYLHPGEAPEPADLGTFQVADVDAVIEELRAAGMTIVSEPADTPWGVREATISDPDGHVLTITSPADPRAIGESATSAHHH